MKELLSNSSMLMTFDIEDWFQVENFKQKIPFSSWKNRELRVEKNTHKILDLLDSFHFRPRATFFVLGWIADKVPSLVREIKKRGHEVASHGNYHHLCTLQSPEALFADLCASRKRLEDVTGDEIFGYRAPSFSVDNHILRLIRKAGYVYDSSFNSFSMHGRYGTVLLSKTRKIGSAYRLWDDFFELPVSNLVVGKKIFPLGGGGYFRLMPIVLFKHGMKAVLKNEDAFIFYSHPWEFDPGQSRVKNISLFLRFRHYVNLHLTEKKMFSMIEDFSHLNFQTCWQYLGVSLSLS